MINFNIINNIFNYIKMNTAVSAISDERDITSDINRENDFNTELSKILKVRRRRTKDCRYE